MKASKLHILLIYLASSILFFAGLIRHADGATLSEHVLVPDSDQPGALLLSGQSSSVPVLLPTELQSEVAEVASGDDESVYRGDIRDAHLRDIHAILEKYNKMRRELDVAIAQQEESKNRMITEYRRCSEELDSIRNGDEPDSDENMGRKDKLKKRATKLKASIELARKTIYELKLQARDMIVKELAALPLSSGGQYEVVKDKIAKGAYGTVYKAKNPLGEVVALKVFRSGAEEVAADASGSTEEDGTASGTDEGNDEDGATGQKNAEDDLLPSPFEFTVSAFKVPVSDSGSFELSDEDSGIESIDSEDENVMPKAVLIDVEAFESFMRELSIFIYMMVNDKDELGKGCVIELKSVIVDKVVNADGDDIVTDLPILVFEFMSTGLDDYVDAQPTHSLDTETILAILTQLVKFLLFAQSIGLLHRDLKTNNVLVNVISPGVLRIKVIDFGEAVILKHGAMKQVEEDNFYHINYRAPELVLRGKYDFRADMYAVGSFLPALWGARVIALLGDELDLLDKGYRAVGLSNPDELMFLKMSTSKYTLRGCLKMLNSFIKPEQYGKKLARLIKAQTRAIAEVEATLHAKPQPIKERSVKPSQQAKEEARVKALQRAERERIAKEAKAATSLLSAKPYYEELAERGKISPLVLRMFYMMTEPDPVKRPSAFDYHERLESLYADI